MPRTVRTQRQPQPSASWKGEHSISLVAGDAHPSLQLEFRALPCWCDRGGLMEGWLRTA